MNELAEGQPSHAKPWRKVNSAMLPALIGALLFLLVVAALFQLFGRYEYRYKSGIVWRIDRITHHACRVIGGGRVNCNPPPPSTSTSTSLSPSISLKAGHNGHR
jgi:hypothetical protein